LNVEPELRGIATQLNPLCSEPVIAVWTMFQRFGAGATPGGDVHVEQVMTPAPLSLQLQPLLPLAVVGDEVLGSVSGVLPSIIRSIDPELSMSSMTLGSGGFVSVCWALAPLATATSATAADAAVNDRGQHWARLLLTSGTGPGRR
jgi:hypothetical protein